MSTKPIETSSTRIVGDVNLMQMCVMKLLMKLLKQQHQQEFSLLKHKLIPSIAWLLCRCVKSHRGISFFIFSNKIMSCIDCMKCVMSDWSSRVPCTTSGRLRTLRKRRQRRVYLLRKRPPFIYQRFQFIHIPYRNGKRELLFFDHIRSIVFISQI